MKSILLWLESPLQSWGADSKFKRRGTMPFPTKSGILGLILCAMGKSGKQIELLSVLNKSYIDVFTYDSNLPLEDFQMVGSGYDDKDDWEKLFIPKKSNGKKCVGGGTILTYRYYLQDSKFGVIIDVDDTIAGSISKALINPVYSIYLGRKCCVPSDIVYRGSFSNKDDALKALEVIEENKGLKKIREIKDGSYPTEGDVMVLNDVPIQFGKEKIYKSRMVTRILQNSEDLSNE